MKEKEPGLFFMILAAFILLINFAMDLYIILYVFGVFGR